MERVEAFFSGRVQGVGFRWTTVASAKGLQISGWVKNLPDGRVQLVAEGQRTDLEILIERVTQRMEPYIEKATTDWQPALGNLKPFAVAT